MNHGYARCSTNESKQDIDRQVRELKQAGAESIFLEYEHGDAAVKCQLSSLLEQAQPGDTIITLEVSRLARSTKQLCEIIEIIRSKHLRLVIVGSITVDCSNGEIDPMTNEKVSSKGCGDVSRRVKMKGMCSITFPFVRRCKKMFQDVPRKSKTIQIAL